MIWIRVMAGGDGADRAGGWSGGVGGEGAGGEAAGFEASLAGGDGESGGGVGMGVVPSCWRTLTVKGVDVEVVAKSWPEGAEMRVRVSCGAA